MTSRRAEWPVLQDTVRIELIRCLMSSLPQAAGMSVASTLGAVLLASSSGAAIDAGFATLLATIGVYRVVVLLSYRSRRDAAPTLVSALCWYRRHAAGLIAQAAVLGLQSLHAFTSGDTAAALLSLSFVMAFCAGACARLSVVPWIPITTSLLLLVPTILGALMSAELPIRLTGVFLIAFIAVLTEATLYLHRLVVDHLLSLQEASRRASLDDLTGLANRTSFHKRLALACREAEETEQDFAVLYIDLDGFKAVNDQMGHAAGDAVLIEIARRLCVTIGPDDLACRLGGDEFAVLVGTDPSHTAVAALAGQLATAIAHPIQTTIGPVEVGASIGVAYTAVHATGADELLNAADQAMYAAKADGGARRRTREPPIGSEALAAG